MKDQLLTEIAEIAEALGMKSPSEQMLVEFTNNGGIQFPDTIQCGSNVAKGGLTRISGVFLHKDRFEPGVLREVVERFQSQIRSGQALGELRGAAFRSSPVVNPANSALLVGKLELDSDGNAVGTATICSLKLAALLKAGWLPGLFARGLGRVNAKGLIRPGYRLLAIDAGWNGSASSVTAVVTNGRRGLNESTQAQINESFPAEPTAAAATNRLITPEMLGETIQERIDRQNRMAAWIASVKNNTPF
ncbi:hypothetical protein [Shewanella algae]|uniref:hypothetical protein n=1 Tax=Shewanella algae TaxID=38313 RepID=UPI000D19BB46|nr:hypothetical protein [Shewanella algae]PSS73034.1 hypothetical protein AYI88_10380 [Shewanella algae]